MSTPMTQDNAERLRSTEEAVRGELSWLPRFNTVNPPETDIERMLYITASEQVFIAVEGDPEGMAFFGAMADEERNPTRDIEGWDEFLLVPVDKLPDTAFVGSWQGLVIVARKDLEHVAESDEEGTVVHWGLSAIQRAARRPETRRASA